MRALVMASGGGRGVFTVGVLWMLRERGLIPGFFDYYIGSSAGGCTAAYGATGQIEEVYRAYTEHMPRYFFRAGLLPKADIVWLERLFDEIEPLDNAALRALQTPAYAVIADLTNKRLCYERLNDAAKPTRIIAAGAAMPYYCEPVVIGDRLCCDGALGDPIPYRKAIEDGADEVWIVLTTPPTYRCGRFFGTLASCCIADPFVRRLLRHAASRINSALRDIRESSHVVIQPQSPVPAAMWGRNIQAAKQTFCMGVAAAKEVLCHRGML